MGASMLNCEESGGLFDDAHAFLRYLEAHKWNTNVAEDKLHATAAWRTAFGVISMRLGGNEMEIAEQNVLGRMHVHGYDKDSHLIVYLKPGNEACNDHTGFLKFVFCLPIIPTDSKMLNCK